MSEGQSVQIKDRPLQCKHCGRVHFVHRTAQLNTAFMEFLELGWLNKSADIYACTHCGFLHWFLEPDLGKEPTPEDDLEEPTECLECHQMIPADAAKCPACGWSYK